MTPEKLRFVDLFAGIGGFHHALSAQPIGAECVMAVEIDKACQDTYTNSFQNKLTGELNFPFVSDIRSLTQNENRTNYVSVSALKKKIPDHDILCGGFPCQPFSKSGKQKGTLDETRGTLFFDIMQIVEAKKPKYIILENVPNLVGPNHRNTTWRTIVAQIRRAGYLVSDVPAIISPHMLDPKIGGTPQVRNRLYILATKRENPSQKQPTNTIRDHLNDIGHFESSHWKLMDFLLDDTATKDHHLKDDEMMWLKAWQHFAKMIPSDQLPSFPIWEQDLKEKIGKRDNCPEWKMNFLLKNQAFYREHKNLINEWREIDWSEGKSLKPVTVKDFPASRRKFEWQARSYQTTRKSRDLFKLLIQFRPSGIRVKPPTYAPALVAITQTTVVGARKRRLTPQEGAVLQGFPSSIFDNAHIEQPAMYKQLGNAVPVGVVKFCANWLLNQQ